MIFWIIQSQENTAQPRTSTDRRLWRSNSLAEELSDRGHDVTRWRSAFNHQKKEFEAFGNSKLKIDTYKQQYLACFPYKRHISLARIRSNLALASNFEKISILKEKPSLIHVGNVPISLAHSAVRFGHNNGIPVIVDIRDLWPDIFIEMLPLVPKIFKNQLIKMSRLASYRLIYSLRYATGITALTESYLKWSLDISKRPCGPFDKVIPMSYPSKVCLQRSEKSEYIRRKYRISSGDLVCTYAGNVGFQSDFAYIVNVASILSEKYKKIKIVIAGDGPRLDRLKELSKDLTNLIFTGWLDGSELSGLLSISDVGLIAFFPHSNYVLNIPNKFPEYLANGLAIACSLDGEMGSLVSRFNCGFNYNTDDPYDLADKLIRLHLNHSSLKAMKSESLLLHKQKFSFIEVNNIFADHLEYCVRAYSEC